MMDILWNGIWNIFSWGINLIITLVSLIIGFVVQIISLFQTIVSGLLFFLPPEITSLVTLAILITIVLRVYGLVRGDT